MNHSVDPPRWMSVVLTLAGFYNLAWGAFAILFPFATFDVLGMPRPLYPSLWGCIGMIVGVYGVGYLLAALHPYRYWPLVLVGLLGKVLGPLGFVAAATRGELPWHFGLTLITNDLIWWVPFTLILVRGYQAYHAHWNGLPVPEFDAALRDTRTPDGVGLFEASNESPLLVVFLRHFGCIFCREALADLAARRTALEQAGTRLVVVHMGTPEQGAEMLARYGLSDVMQVSDPDAALYRAFGLKRATLGQAFAPPLWVRGAVVYFRGGHRIGRLVGDGFQKQGAFVLHRGRIVEAFRPDSVDARPDYVAMAACERASSGTSA